MLCVTIAMVKSCFSSSISSSTLSVLIGSSALVGSSSRITSGRTAMVRAMQRRCCCPPESPRRRRGEPVLHLGPQRGAGERPLDPLVHLRPRELLVQAHAEGDVVVDRHRERRRLLEHHADAAAQRVEVDVGRRGCCCPSIITSPGRALAGIEVVHPVQHAQQRRFAAARGPDHARHLLLRQIEVDPLQRMVAAVVEIEAAHRDARRVERGCRLRAAVAAA